MKNQKNKCVIVLPAYNAEKTLLKVWNKVPKKYAKQIVLVDDGSGDKTVAIARELGIKTFIHSKNKGYGANQKTCYKEALKMKADIVVMLHPDYQYDPEYIPDLIAPIIQGKFDIMIGSRIRTRKETIGNGMPIYKYLGNRMLTFIENTFLGLNLSEYHTGFRAYSAQVLKKIDLTRLSDDFVFDQQILIKAHRCGFNIGEIYSSCRYNNESSSINFIRSIKYGVETIYNLVKG